MKFQCVIATVLSLFVINVAIAETGESTITKRQDGKYEIKSTIVTANGCYSKGAETSSSPSGERIIENAILVTFTLKHSGASLCTQALKPVTFSIAVDAPKGVQAAIIYISDPSTKSLSARAVALPR